MSIPTSALDAYPGETLTTKEAATVLRVGQEMIYELIAAGRLHAKRPGFRYIIPKKSIVAYLEGPQP